MQFSVESLVCLSYSIGIEKAVVDLGYTGWSVNWDYKVLKQLRKN